MTPHSSGKGACPWEAVQLRAVPPRAAARRQAAGWQGLAFLKGCLGRRGRTCLNSSMSFFTVCISLRTFVLSPLSWRGRRSVVAVTSRSPTGCFTGPAPGPSPGSAGPTVGAEAVCFIHSFILQIPVHTCGASGAGDAAAVPMDTGPAFLGLQLQQRAGNPVASALKVYPASSHSHHVCPQCSPSPERAQRPWSCFLVAQRRQAALSRALCCFSPAGRPCPFPAAS